MSKIGKGGHHRHRHHRHHQHRHHHHHQHNHGHHHHHQQHHDHHHHHHHHHHQHRRLHRQRYILAETERVLKMGFMVQGVNPRLEKERLLACLGTCEFKSSPSLSIYEPCFVLLFCELMPVCLCLLIMSLGFKLRLRPTNSLPRFFSSFNGALSTHWPMNLMGWLRSCLDRKHNWVHWWLRREHSRLAQLCGKALACSRCSSAGHGETLLCAKSARKQSHVCALPKFGYMKAITRFC